MPTSQHWTQWARRRWERRDVSGCLVWLNAQRAGDLKDLSGNGNHPTVNSSPVLTTGGPNGMPFWDFSGTHYITFPNVFAALTVCEVFVVVKRADNTNNHDFLWNFSAVLGNGGTRFPFPGDGGIYDDFGTTARKTTGVPTNSPVTDYIVYNVTTKSGGWTSRINGTQHFTTATNTVGFNTTCQLGRVSAAEWFYGSVVDFIAYNRELSSTERALVARDLGRECGIIVA